MKIDKTDAKLLLELMRNSRIPVTTLAKKLKISREVATYRINRLLAEGVILNFITEINMQKLGYMGAAVFIDVLAKREKEFKEYLRRCPYVSWVAELAGVWSFGLSIIGKNNEELDKKFLLLYNQFKDSIIDHRFTLHRISHFFYEKYFGRTALPVQKRTEEHLIDEIDKAILKELAIRSRIDCIELSKNLPISAQAIGTRIKKLKSSGYIEKYSIFMDISKLDLFQYSIFIVNKNIDERKQLLTFLSQHPQISFIAEYVGDPFLEFGLFVKDPYELRERLQEIEESFPDNRIIEISLFQKEFVSIGPPSCTFE